MSISINNMVTIAKSRRYVLVGVWNTIFSLTIFQILIYCYPNLHHQVVLLITFLMANCQSHFMQRRIVWESKKNYFVELTQFLSGSVFSYIVNVAALALLTRTTTFKLMEIQFFITIFLLVFSYLLHSRIIFRSKN